MFMKEDITVSRQEVENAVEGLKLTRIQREGTQGNRLSMEVYLPLFWRCGEAPEHDYKDFTEQFFFLL